MLSGFSVQSHSVAECWGGKRTALSPGAGEGCAKFFLPEQKTSISCFIDVATVTIIKFTVRRGTHTVFILGAETTTAVFTKGSSLSEVEVLNLLFSAPVGHGKRHALPDQLYSF